MPDRGAYYKYRIVIAPRFRQTKCLSNQTL